jgi:hypothetical protein
MAASENLNKDLFPGGAYTRQDMRGWGDFGGTEFTAYGKSRPVGDEQSKWAESPYARIIVERGGFIPNYTNRYSSVPETNYNNRDHSSAYPTGTPNEQGKLFQDIPTKINSFYADPSMTKHSMALMGLAINESRKIGSGLQAPFSLSPHSAPLAQRGAAAGVLTANPYNPTMEDNNTEHFAPRVQAHAKTEKPFPVAGEEELSPETVAEAKGTVKGLLRQQGPVKRAAKRASARRSTPVQPPAISIPTCLATVIQNRVC